MAEVELPNPDELAERRERTFGRRVALVTAVYAVVLALASVGGNNAMEDVLLNQQQASDQWAFYQAKVIREHLYRSQRMVVEAELAAAGRRPEAARERLAALARAFGEEERRYATEKKDIEKDARAHERARDVAKRRDVYFDAAEVFLQIAIVASSVSILAGSRPVFWFSLALAAIGALAAANGLTLLLAVPALESP